MVELVVTLVLGTSAERREGSSPSLRTMSSSTWMNLGRYQASLREIDKKPVHSQVAESVDAKVCLRLVSFILSNYRFESCPDYKQSSA